MKIMTSGTGFFLCIGTGLGIGLFAGPGWGWQALAAAMIIAIANVLLKSENYQNYIAACEGKEIKLESFFLQKFILKGGKTKPSVISYISLSFLLNSIIILVVSVIANAALAGKYFDKEDEKALSHLSGALMSWYEVNQLGLSQSDADMERVFSLLNRVHSECSKVPDKTLKKIDAEFAAQWRQNLQEGARQYEMGLRGYYGDVKSGRKPSPRVKTQANNGQQKMVQFHTYYNANIERIIRYLKSKGVDWR